MISTDLNGTSLFIDYTQYHAITILYSLYQGSTPDKISKKKHKHTNGVEKNGEDEIHDKR